MRKTEFSSIRHHLGKTQNQMAQLLGTSLKAIQSFEQGWRNIPMHVERQALFLLAYQSASGKGQRRCWVIQECPDVTKKNCPAWQLKLGHLCWFINGTICHGQVQRSWQTKMKLCRKCEVFESVFPILYSPGLLKQTTLRGGRVKRSE